jgi:hypothetical protein
MFLRKDRGRIPFSVTLASIGFVILSHSSTTYVLCFEGHCLLPCLIISKVKLICFSVFLKVDMLILIMYLANT